MKLKVDRTVGTLFGSSINALCRDILRYFKINDASLHIEDAGAYDFVIAARVEACVRQVMRIDTPLDIFCTESEDGRTAFSQSV